LGEGEDLVQVNFKVATPHLYSAFFETFRQCVFTGTPATVIRPCTLPGIEDHVFQPGDILHSMAEACAMDADVYGPDVRYWKGHRFVGEGDQLLKYDLTFGLGRSRKCRSVPTHAERDVASVLTMRNSMSRPQLCHCGIVYARREDVPDV